MATLKIIDGDYKAGQYTMGTLIMTAKDAKLGLLGRKPTVLTSYSAEIVDENNYKAVMGTVGWAVAGGLATGGIGLIAGALLGGNKKKRFVLITNHEDGKQGLVETNVVEANRIVMHSS